MKEVKIFAIGSEEFELITNSNNVIYVDTVNQMKLTDKLEDGMVINTLGYHSPKDGGEGSYLIRPRLLTDIDDGGSIHVINDEFVAELIIKNKTVNVKQFGAYGDSLTDDSTYIQKCIDFAGSEYKIEFVKGTYLAFSLLARGGVNIDGRGATLMKPILSQPPYNMTADQMKWKRLLEIIHNDGFESDFTSVKNLNFNGNCWLMWSPEDGYSQEQASLLYVSASNNDSNTGKLHILIEDCNFIDNVSDGIHIRTNVNANINNCNSLDCFRGGLVITGGNTDVNCSNCKFESRDLADGIDIEVDGSGFYNSKRVNVNLTNIVIDKDFDIAVSEDSIVRCSNITLKNGTQFYNFAKNSKIIVENSIFNCIGVNPNIFLVEKGDITYNNCTFIGDTTNKITMNNTSNGFNSSITFDGCKFDSFSDCLCGGVMKSNVRVLNSIFGENISGVAIGGKLGNVNFAPLLIEINNCSFNNPGKWFQSMSTYTPSTMVHLSNNKILNPNNAGWNIHNNIMYFHNEIYDYGYTLASSSGRKPVILGKRTILVDEDPTVSGITGFNYVDIAMLRDGSGKWERLGGQWIPVSAS